MIMKKKDLFLAGLAALSLVACQVEEVEKVVDAEKEEHLSTITANVNEASTKAFVDGLQVKWSEHDVIVVVDDEDTNVDFTLTAGENTSSGTFSGDLGGKALGNYALYPKSTNSEIAGPGALVEYLTEWDYGKSEVPMYGIKGIGDAYTFSNIGGAIKVVYSNVPSEAKKFVITETHTGGAEKYITGPVLITDLDSTPEFDFGSLDGQTVTVHNVTSGDLTLVVPIPTASGYNFNVKLLDASSKTIPGSEKNATGIEIKENKLKPFPTIVIPDSKVFFEERSANSTGSCTSFSGGDGNGTFVADNAGWTVKEDKKYGAGACAKFGTSSVVGEATTPSISITEAYRSLPVTLHFKAAPWSKSSTVTTLNLTVTGASVSSSSVTMTKGEWKEFDVTLSGLTASVSVKFACAERFFLDDVVVFFGPTLPSERALPGFSYSTHSYAAATGGVFVAPTLTNPNNITGIKYSSSDEEIASVDEDSGAITIGSKAGTVRITASFDGDMTYRPGNDYYDIDVSDPVYVYYWINGVKNTVAAAEGQALNTLLPLSPDCGVAGYTFAGWSESTVTTTDTEPTYTSQTTVPALGITLYAVFVIVDEEDVAANNVSFTPDNCKDPAGAYSHSNTANGVTIEVSNGICNSTEFRIYKNSTLSITSTSRNITSVSVTGKSGKPASGFNQPDGWTKTTSGVDGTWTPAASSKSITLTASGAQVQSTEIVVSLAAGKRTTYSGYTTSPVAP